ncbi:MAG TPA: hypothetical protein VGE07_02130 [Herpetosiphonaceae bacterium]
MLIAWRGWGWLVGVVFFGMPILAQVIVEAVSGEGAYARNGPAFFACALIAGAVVLWFLGRFLNGRDSPYATSNFEVAHSFLYLRMEYWAVAFVAFALIAVLIQL